MHSTKNESPISQSSPSALEKWFLATRPKTWVASLSPVIIGTVMAPSISWGLFLMTALFALFIQIGTNFANDYSDFVKGADTKERQGPKRAVAEGWIKPAVMKKATALVFITAALIALPLMVVAGLWSLFIVIAAIASGILYTAGPKPLGYLGLGEVFVLVFFGPVSACGAYFLQTGLVTPAVLIASLAPGFLSCSLLVANNLRDEKTDAVANKKTLVVRFGRLFGQLEYTLSLAVPLVIPLILVFCYAGPLNLIGVFFLFPIAIRLIKAVFSFNEPKALLQGTSLLFFFYTLLFSVSFL